MPNKCVVKGCSTQGAGMGFPKDPELNLKWRIAVKRHMGNGQPTDDAPATVTGPERTLWKPSEHSKVCRSHFKPEDFKESMTSAYSANPSSRRKYLTLKEGAIPSIFPWSASTPSPGPSSSGTVPPKFIEPVPTTSADAVPVVEIGQEGPQKKKHYVREGAVPSIFPWSSVSSPTAEERPSADPAEPATEQESPVKMTCEVDISAMKEEEMEEEEETVEIAIEEEEEEEVAEDDFGDQPTFHCGECDFKAMSVDVLKAHRMTKHLATWVQNLKSRPEMRKVVTLPPARRGRPPPAGTSWTNGLRRLYPCPMCNLKLQSLAGMRRHLHLHHQYNKKTFLCRFCHKSSMTRDDWSAHYSNCQSFNHLMCPEPGCEYVTKRREEIQEHMSTDHVDNDASAAAGDASSLRLFMCHVCNSNLELKGKVEFRRHVDQCKKGGADLENESRGEPKIQVGVSSFKCRRCKSKFLSLSDFDKHVIESGDPPTCEEVPDNDDEDVNVERLKCDRCDFAFTAIANEFNRRNSQHQITKHYKTEHGVQGTWLCGRVGCDFRSDCPKLIRRHREEERGKTQCELCGVTVVSSHLKSHMRIHKDVTYDCEHCSRPYAQGSALKAHIFKHHGLEAHAKYVEKVHEKKFKEPGMCDTCGKHVEDQRVHLLAWHPDISAPKMYNEILKKPIRKLSEKPRWAERLNKRQRVLVKEGKLPATPDDGDGAEISRQGDGSVRYGYGKETTDQSSSSQH